MSSVHWSGSCKVTLSKQKKCYFSSCMNRPQTLFSLVACFYFAFHLSSILGLFNRQPLGWYPPALSRILQNLLSKTQFTFRSVLKGKGVLWQPAAPFHHSSNSIRDPTARCNSILHSVGQFKGAYRELTTWHQEISLVASALFPLLWPGQRANCTSTPHPTGRPPTHQVTVHSDVNRCPYVAWIMKPSKSRWKSIVTQNGP